LSPIKPLGELVSNIASLIAVYWLKLGDVMGFVVSKAVVGIIFFLFLLPIALIYRAFKKDPLGLRKEKSSYWLTRNYKYLPKDLENTW